MGIVKTEIFTPSQNRLASYAKVLGHPARISILQYLFKLDGCVCGELVNEIGLAQATISQHLKELKSIGFIKGTVEGTSICYCINADKWLEMKEEISNFLNQTSASFNCC